MSATIPRHFVAFGLAATLALPAAAEPPAAPAESAHLASIAATLERIERLLRLGQSAQMLELKLDRFLLAFPETTMLEAEVRQLRESESWEGPEMKTQEQRLEALEAQLEEARRAGDPQAIEEQEKNFALAEMEVRASRRAMKARREQRESFEAELASLKAERDAALAEIDTLFARLETEMRRERQP